MLAEIILLSLNVSPRLFRVYGSALNSGRRWINLFHAISPNTLLSASYSNATEIEVALSQYRNFTISLALSLGFELWVLVETVLVIFRSRVPDQWQSRFFLSSAHWTSRILVFIAVSTVQRLVSDSWVSVDEVPSRLCSGIGWILFWWRVLNTSGYDIVSLIMHHVLIVLSLGIIRSCRTKMILHYTRNKVVG